MRFFSCDANFNLKGSYILSQFHSRYAVSEQPSDPIVSLVNGYCVTSLPNKVHHYYRLPPATKLGQGNIFRSVCQEFCSRGGGVSRPTPKVEVEGSGQGGPPGPHPGWRLWGLAGGGSPGPHLGGGELRALAGGGSPAPHPGGS